MKSKLADKKKSPQKSKQKKKELKSIYANLMECGGWIQIDWMHWLCSIRFTSILSHVFLFALFFHSHKIPNCINNHSSYCFQRSKDRRMCRIELIAFSHSYAVLWFSRCFPFFFFLISQFTQKAFYDRFFLWCHATKKKN